MTIDYKEINWSVIAVTAALPDVVTFHGQCNKSLELESSYMSENLVLISFF